MSPDREIIGNVFSRTPLTGVVRVMRVGSQRYRFVISAIWGEKPAVPIAEVAVVSF